MLVSGRFKAVSSQLYARNSRCPHYRKAIGFLDHTPVSELIFHPSRLLNL